MPKHALAQVEITRILLVDDDPFQGMARKSILQSRFAGVRRVPDAAEALCLLEEPGLARTLELVLISGHPPHGMTKPCFVTELVSRLPERPVLVLGGQQDDPHHYEAISPFVRFLPRKTTADHLLAEVSHLLVYETRRAS